MIKLKPHWLLLDSLNISYHTPTKNMPVIVVQQSMSNLCHIIIIFKESLTIKIPRVKSKYLKQ